MSWKMLLAGGAALVLIVSWTAMRNQAATPVYDKAKESLMMRAVGHAVLLQAGDARSRILPVEQTGDHEYVLHFESPFTFVPDSLVQVVDRVVKAQGLPPTYLVEVLTCRRDEVIFGFAIQPDSAHNIVPCKGREQQKDCYKIRLRFPGNTNQTASNYWMAGTLGAIGLSLLLRWLYARRQPKQPATIHGLPNGLYIEEGTTETTPQASTEATTEATVEATPPPSPAMAIGQYLFYPVKQVLVFQQRSIPLTAKEARILQVFAASPNVVIDRDRLQKEVWEDEGVIVGRSLDMFVSKLRKKLQDDPGIALINEHGKGYKLAIEG